ncbi:MAG: flavin reductase family protein [Microthrixaceae bacterium]|nr:flavin reductase family protein [Microthrixaceae bacterium]
MSQDVSNPNPTEISGGDVDPSADEIEIDPTLFRKVLGHYPTGVVIVASLEESHPVGLAIGSFFSVSLDPPLVGFCVARSSSSWPRIERTGVFGITVLADDQQETSGRFASSAADKFEGEQWEPAPVTGSPLIQRGVGHIDCELYSVSDGGDHLIVLGRVRYLDVHRPDAGPLLFFRGGYGRHISL